MHWPPSLAIISFAAVAFLMGCGSDTTVSLPGMPGAPLPVYGLGDSYRFSDGTTDTVTSAGPAEVHWRDDSGTFVTARDTLLPAIAWTTATTRGERRIGGGTNLLFPLQPGRSVRFTATRTVTPASGGAAVTTSEDWLCRVAGAAQTQVPAGRFATWQINCGMTLQPDTGHAGILQRTFYYAPDIGFYVRRDDTVGDGPTRVIELADYRSAEPALPQSALRERSAGIQTALEREVSGQPTQWTDTTSGDSGDVRVLDTKHSDKYGWCRDFAEDIRASGRLFPMHGTGCRNTSGIWELVVLAPGASAGS